MFFERQTFQDNVVVYLLYKTCRVHRLLQGWDFLKKRFLFLENILFTTLRIWERIPGDMIGSVKEKKSFLDIDTKSAEDFFSLKFVYFCHSRTSYLEF